MEKLMLKEWFMKRITNSKIEITWQGHFKLIDDYSKISIIEIDKVRDSNISPIYTVCCIDREQIYDVIKNNYFLEDDLIENFIIKFLSEYLHIENVAKVTPKLHQSGLVIK